MHEKTNNLGSDRSDTNKPVHTQKMVRGQKFCTTRIAKTKSLISFAVIAKLICAFVFWLCRLLVFPCDGTYFLFILSVCGLNVHKRCQKNVANNCGINTRDMAQILQEMGITTDKLTAKGRKKVNHNVLQNYNCGINTRDMAQILQEMGITSDKLTAKGRKKVNYNCSPKLLGPQKLLMFRKSSIKH